MKRPVLLSLLLLTCTPLPALAAEEAVKLDDENARINYSVAYQIGNDFRRQGLEIDPEILARGVADAMADAEPLLTPTDMRQELADLQQRMLAARKAMAEEVAAKQRQAGKEFLEANKDKEGVKVTESGLQYKIIEPGTGPQPGPTDTVRVNYRGTLIDGKEFDSSYKRGNPAEVRLDRVIKGWTEGLQLLKEGGKAQLFIPSELAYGERGRLGNQTLIFDVELIAVVPPAPEGGEEVPSKAAEDQE